MERSKALLDAMASAARVADALRGRHLHDDIIARAALACAQTLCAIADALETQASAR